MSTNSSPSCEGQRLPNVIRLEVRQLVPNLKNTKRVSGKRLVHDRETREAIREIVRGFVSQLLSGIQTSADATVTAQQVYYLTRLLPHDDCWTCIPDLRVTAELADEDGATITIERL